MTIVDIFLLVLIIFILWWAVMWGMDLLVMAPSGPGGGMAIAMGLPVFVLGILFLVNSKKRRASHPQH